MSVETAQICRCDRCGAQHIAALSEQQEEPFTPPDWLVLSWARFLPGDEKPLARECNGQLPEYRFAFCPDCASSFVEFAAHSRGGGPQLQLIKG